MQKKKNTQMSVWGDMLEICVFGGRAHTNESIFVSLLKTGKNKFMD